MKRIALLFFASTFLITSCSSDNDSASGNSNDKTDYFPLEIGNYWTYNVTDSSVMGRDSLYVANDTVINSKTYKKFKTKGIPFGSISGSVASNGMRKENGKLLVSGSAGFSLIEDIPFIINLNDFVIFKESAADNEQLSSISGTFERQYEGITLLFTYTLKTVAVTTLPTYSVGEKVYPNVKSVKTILNLQISTNVPQIPLPVVVMESQDVLTSTQYYAKDKGIVYATTAIGYELNSSIALLLGIPATFSQGQQESLDTYHFAE